MKIKGIIGIVLVIASVAGIFFWETQFRDRLLFQDVLVAAVDIHPGEIVDEGSFKILSVTNESIVSNVLHPKDSGSLIGLVCTGSVRENSQLSLDDFAKKEELDPENSFTMVLPSEWILINNSELRIGDKVSVYCMPEKHYLGTYTVKKVEGDEDCFVEIQIGLNEYFHIYDEVRSFTAGNKFGSSECLLLVSERSL